MPHITSNCVQAYAIMDGMCPFPHKKIPTKVCIVERHGGSAVGKVTPVGAHYKEASGVLLARFVLTNP